MVIRDNTDPVELQVILSASKGERKITQYLKQNPALIYWAFCRTGGHVNYVFSDFTVGNQFEADFVVLHTYSSTFEAHFIELESVRDPVFNKARTPSKRLATATRQIDDWKEYISKNEWPLRQDLVRWCKTRDILNVPTPDRDPANYAKELLVDPSTMLYVHYYIIIGMREDLTAEKRDLKDRYRKHHGIDVGSYDRFLDIASSRYVTKRPTRNLITAYGEDQE